MADDMLEAVVTARKGRRPARSESTFSRGPAISAEKRASKAISLEDVAVPAIAPPGSPHLRLKSLKDDERRAASGRDRRAGAPVIFLFAFMKNRAGYTRFHEISQLDSIRLINADFHRGGERGRSRVISLRYEPDEILSRLGT